MLNSAEISLGLASTAMAATPAFIGLKGLYPDINAPLRGVVEITMKNLAAGYILGFDAAETIEAAYKQFQP